MTMVILIVTLLFAILCWRDLRSALILLAGLLPTYLLRFSIGPLPSTLLEALVLVAFAIWFVRYRAWRIDYPRTVGTYFRPLVLLLAAASFGVVVAHDSISALGTWKAYFIEPAMIFLMMRTVFQNEKDWRAVAYTLGVSSLVVSAIAIVQVVTGHGIPAPWDIERRATSIFDYPNALGLFLAPITSFAAVLAVQTKEMRGRTFWFFTAAFGAIGIILAKTEAAFVAIPAALLISLLFSHISKKKKIFALGATTILAAILFISIPVVREKLTLQDYSGQVRLSQWSETAALLKDHPIFGVGLNEYPAALAPYHDVTLYEIFQYPHNILLNIWIELGFLGLIAFFWIAWVIFRDTNHQPLTTNHGLKLAAFAALLTMVIHGLVDVPYFKNDLSALTWILIALFSWKPRVEK